MNIDEDVCKLLSAKEGLPLDFILKEMYMMELLGMLSSEGALKEMVFKGGTALNNVYIKNYYRFSEDLDFDFVGKNWEKFRDRLIIDSKEFTSHESRYFRTMKVYQIDYMYKVPWSKADRIRIDVNFDPKTKTVDPIKGENVESRFIGVNVSDVPTYGLEDLVARKMNALKDRAEGKDIFDVSNSIKLTNKKKLLKAIDCIMLASKENMSSSEFIEKIVNKMKNFDYKKLRNLTNPYIPIRNRPSDWKMLIDDLMQELTSLRKEIKS